MKPLFSVIAASFCLSIPGAHALAQQHNPHPRADAKALSEPQSKPINAMCPIGKEPINERAGTTDYKGHTLGFCCPSCSAAFMKWDESRRDAFVQLALAGKEPGHAHAEHSDSKTMPAMMKDDAPEGKSPHVYYPLNTCPVSGMKLGSMGDPVVKFYDGREVRFCCSGCIDKFEAKKTEYFAKMDKAIIEQQLEAYPMATCPVSGMELGSMGEPVNYVHHNRLVRFCCSGCIDKFEAKPATYHAKLDKAYADAQRDSYPLDTCVVSGMELGSMGEPHEIVAGTTLVRFCCSGCVENFWKEPQKYLGKLQRK